MSEPIDIKDALERVQDDVELLIELFEIFQEDFEMKLDILTAAVDGGDVEKVREIAHGLKGATGNISAVHMHQNCKEIEAMAKDGSLDGVKMKVEALATQYAEVKTFVIKYAEENA